MPVPDFQSLMLPTLKALVSGAELPLTVVRECVAVAEGLSDEDLREVLPSGRQKVFVNRVSWAMLGMERAGLVERVRRAVYRITPEGRRLLSRNVVRIDLKLLREFPAYVEYYVERRSRRRRQSPHVELTEPQENESGETPEEILEHAAGELRTALEVEVLARVRAAAPAFLERVVVDLLIAMGYGGGDAANGRVTGRSGDSGIDGKIREDTLGLDEVYLQAKKYADGNTVGEGDLRNFAGAIDAAGTTKGVFVTTSGFTQAAKNYVALSPKRIVLIDGEELARLMVRHGIGVRTRITFELKRIDEDYFESEEL